MNPVVVIKCGGSLIDELADSFFESLRQCRQAGYNPVIVHGGGPGIGRMLKALGVTSEFVDGLRKTDAQVMKVVEMVLCGSVNKSLVRKMSRAGLDVAGLSGCDNHLLEAVPRDAARLGYVGDVAHVCTDWLEDLIARGIVPVIAPVGIGPGGSCYNINADTAAGAIARALKAEKLLFATDVAGILNEGRTIPSVTAPEVADMIAEGTIHGGMIPKVQAAVESLDTAMDEVMIVDGKHEPFFKNGEMIGTMIEKNGKVMI